VFKNVSHLNSCFKIFNGAYGSEEENRLEDNLDHVEEMRNRIAEANFKWRQVIIIKQKLYFSMY